MTGFGTRGQMLAIVPHGCSTGPLERRAEMDRFQHGSDKPGAPRPFFLSMRAGWLDIKENLGG